MPNFLNQVAIPQSFFMMMSKMLLHMTQLACGTSRMGLTPY
jgi:hypothetical protein